MSKLYGLYMKIIEYNQAVLSLTFNNIDYDLKIKKI